MLDIKMPCITRTRLQGNMATYEIQPLEPGYGMTIGHALQRVLYSSLPGAAITTIRLETSQSLSGVKEDISDILLNLKQIRLRSSSEQPASMHLHVSGARAVTAPDIIVPDTIELLTPKCHIAQLERHDAHLAMELIVQMGRGYVPADVQAQPPFDDIPLDAIFTPVCKVLYAVERTRVGAMVNFEKVTLEITTDGTLTPDVFVNDKPGLTHF